MSRTDKDAPWWVQAEYWKPVHWNCENDLPRGPYLCDLPTAPVRKDRSHKRYGTFFPGDFTCTWEAEWPRRNRYPYTAPPNRENRHLMWWRPDRRKVRDLMAHAKQLANGGSDPDVITPLYHRHHPYRSGWWD